MTNERFQEVLDEILNATTEELTELMKASAYVSEPARLLSMGWKKEVLEWAYEHKFDPSEHIAIIWSEADVRAERPDLNKEQAMDVLDQIEEHHNAECGVSWSTIRDTANELFPLEGDDE